MLHLAIALGGMAGALARHAAGLSIDALAGMIFPWGTLAVNAAGSALLGLLVAVAQEAPLRPALRAALTVGFCGGVTTFSAFSQQTVALAQSGRLPLASVYVGASLALGVGAVLAGRAAGARLGRAWRARLAA
jgi:fluoride exporter